MQFTTASAFRVRGITAVYYGAKILILMQFTTHLRYQNKLLQLFIMVQRY